VRLKDNGSPQTRERRARETCNGRRLEASIGRLLFPKVEAHRAPPSALPREDSGAGGGCMVIGAGGGDRSGEGGVCPTSGVVGYDLAT
jgi:hypothetical protein